MIRISDHVIDNSDGLLKFSLHDTPNHSGLFSAGMPDTLVIHYTAGAGYQSTAEWLCNETAGASAHLVIGRQGELAQLLPFNKMAWHAGTSAWKGRTHLNRFSIGIELANAGMLTRRASGYFTSFGQKVADDKVVLARHKSRTSEEAWEAFSEAQLEMCEAVCIALKQCYDIKEIVGHDDIAPERKIDPGPAFPMEHLRSKVLFGRSDASEEAPLLSAGHPSIQGLVLAELLNIRASPVLNAATVAEPLRKGTRFSVLKQDDRWVKVKVVTEGWIHKDFIKLVE
ncbi:N-acetylmuramoyl-L-alanine amidase [Roseimarinus sediminis]|uniref:N-acetylmuramoyl-L-alanine amidase n=1 Tax=Roseimarinus sediminis TaxID=1610899 RepID=UPI003D1C6634